MGIMLMPATARPSRRTARIFSWPIAAVHGAIAPMGNVNACSIKSFSPSISSARTGPYSRLVVLFMVFLKDALFHLITGLMRSIPQGGLEGECPPKSLGLTQLAH